MNRAIAMLVYVAGVFECKCPLVNCTKVSSELPDPAEPRLHEESRGHSESATFRTCGLYEQWSTPPRSIVYISSTPDTNSSYSS